jgi:hypothetical protein
MIGAVSQRRQELTQALSFLADDLVEWMVPLLERIALLVDDASHEHNAGDEPNGFTGLVRRGPLDRLLLSEWLLATEEPDEFIRRFAMSELSYLELDNERPASTARIEVIVDSGPLAVGAPRLAFLLVMTVLSQRAEALGVPFAVGVMGDEPGTFNEGSMSDVFASWLHSRRSFLASDDHIAEWVQAGEPNAKRWLLGGHTRERTFPGVRVVRAEASGWNDAGVSHVAVWVDQRKVVLPLVDSTAAVRLLRGYGLRKQPLTTRSDVVDVPVKSPRFWTRDTRLLMRTEHTDVLASLRVDMTGAKRNGLRRHQFGGPVVAASVIGDRVVGAVVVDDELRIETIGKPLGRASRVAVPLSELSFDPWQISQQTLEPLLFQSAFFLRAEDIWYRLESAQVDKQSVITIGASNVNDQPRLAYKIGSGLYLDGGTTFLDEPVSSRDILLGPRRGSFAVQQNAAWTLIQGTTRTAVITEPDDTVVGVVEQVDGPALVTLSSGGHILRLRSPYRVKTLTAMSGSIVDFSLHPTHPLLALQRVDGLIEVMHLLSEKVVAQVTQSHVP